ncbi:hypothetical protein ACIQUQ_24365 [Streptomyces sp. NPDC101118]|uniref:hypothetical protein n=1 Tax=Streptomyces sp. NPDC101118 TaxID=3366109 RepID=UPI00381E9404
MHTFSDTHTQAHCARAAELRAAARDWQLAHEAGRAGRAHGLRNRLGEALVGAGTRLMHAAPAA